MSADGPRLRVAALVIRDDRVLLVRHVKDGETRWLLPGGGVDRGETLADALHRELREETGLQVAPGPLVSFEEAVSPDGARHVVQLVFRAEILSGAPRATGDDARVAEAVFVPVAELPNLRLHLCAAGRLAELAREKESPGIPGAGNLWKP
ncbi:MAG: NUDIX domain-containing protein [Candidatus Hydrogenedentes bacterium]|nr:NUDIX domain-containing protein [Candidatus Hydrogenedentota bacterium]